MIETDHELMTKIKLGNEEAFNKLCTKYRKRLTSYIIGKVSRKELAEEIVQDTFLSIFRNKDKFDDSSNKFSSWAYKIAKNTMIDSVRRKKQKMMVLVDRMPDQGSYKRDLAAELSYDAAINKLPENLLAVFKAVCIDGMDHNEASQLLGISSDNVRARTSRARSQLRAIIGTG